MVRYDREDQGKGGAAEREGVRTSGRPWRGSGFGSSMRWIISGPIPEPLAAVGQLGVGAVGVDVQACMGAQEQDRERMGVG